MGLLSNNGSISRSDFVANGKQRETMMSTSPYYEHQKRPKTKIVCTLGPASRSREMIERLLRAGMNVARFNFSHGSHDYHQETLDNLRAAVASTAIPCAVMLDTKGPEIRTGFLKDGKSVQLKEGQEITITTDYSIKGDHNTIAMSYKKLAHDLKPQSLILCADGSISLKVLHCDEEAGLVRCRCLNAAVLGERKNVNLPGVAVDLPTLTEKDIDDIMRWGIPNQIDVIALSFVRKADDIVRVRELLGAHAGSVLLMAKVENQEGLTNFDRILEESDAFMVARGDLGMEIPIEKMFVAQKTMIRRCNEKGKAVVTATQMLESMTASPRPTRAEATDVANAVLDGTDCVMLSGETAAGAYPVEAVETMARICIEAEGCLDHGRIFWRVVEALPQPLSPSESESLACLAAQAANAIGAALIVVVDEEGGTAELVAKYRPSAAILSVEAGEKKGKAARLVLRGVTAVAVQSVSDEEAVVEMAVKTAKARRLCKEGESVVAAYRRRPLRTAVTILTVG